MSDLKQQLIRLGKQEPSLRKHLRPILDEVTSKHSSRNKTSQISLDDLRHFDLVGFSEEEYEETLDELQQVSDTRSAYKVFKKVAEADPGSFEVISVSPDTTDNTIVYINTGDTYSPTLLFDEGVGDVQLLTWGDAAEAYERAYFKQNFMEYGIESEVAFDVSLDQLSPDEEVQVEDRVSKDLDLDAAWAEVQWVPEHVEILEDHDSLYAEGYLYVKDIEFLQEKGLTRGDLSRMRDVEKGLEQFLGFFIKYELGVELEDQDINMKKIRQVTEPEKVDEPDYRA